jgi:hypothetical protein
VLDAALQTHALQHLFGHLCGLGARITADPQRHGHVVQRAELGQQVVKLVDETQVPVAQFALLRRRERGKLLPPQPHLPAGGRIQPAQKVQQRALARAGSAHDGQRFAGAHLQVHALQHGDVEAAFGEALGQALA